MRFRVASLLLATSVAWHWLIAMAHPQSPGDLAAGTAPPVPSKSLPAGRPLDAQRSGDGLAWLRPWPDDFPFDKLEEIAATDSYEMVASQVDFQKFFDGPNEPSFAAISLEDAIKYTGYYYRCPEGKRPYRFRAVYGNVGTGGFHIGHVGRKVVINHGSLGDRLVAKGTYFILNLDFEPESVYILAGVAR